MHRAGVSVGLTSVGVLCTACIADIGSRPAAGEPATITFVAPAPGSTHPRDTLVDTGELAASVDVAIAVSGPVARVELTRGERALGVLDAGGQGSAELVDVGQATLTATGYDDSGAPVAVAAVDISVIEPTIADCRGWLDLYGLMYEVGPTSRGVADPVTVTTPINGVAYRSASTGKLRSTFFMDCELARSLARAAPLLRDRGVVEITDIGVYNYRCIGNAGTPPDCPLSQHAFARGIDIAGFTDRDGVHYSVNDDWIIDGASEKTCAAATTPGKDRFLHEAICALKAAGVWNIVLTPNYNAAHRNHFHVDLTPGASFLRSRGTVDDGPDHH